MALKKSLKFEQAMEQLEEIIQILDEGEADLEASLKLYAEALELTAFCENKLKEAKRKVKLVESEKTAK